jgi:hypothetical protein
VRSVFNELKKLSIAELSQTSPARLMLQVMPCSLSSSWKCSLVYWLPWSEWCNSSTGLPRRQTAIINASATSCEVMLDCIDQPTMRRE